MGFDARWGVLGAADVGANHQRDRIWIVGKMGNANNNGQTAAKVTTSIDERGDPSKAWTEQASQFTRPSEQYAELADAKELFSNGGNNNASISMERKTQSKFRNDSWSKDVSNPNSTQRQGMCITKRVQQKHPYACSPSWWEAEPNVGRVVDGMAAGNDRLKAIGNGQVPLCAATAWRILSQ
jgi:DNA (cytosine-5)-methyltransferase 1